VRVTTAFNKMLSIPGATVASVEFGTEGVVVGLRRRASRPRCPCGWRGTGVYDSSTRRWRHLDLGASKLLLEAEIRRLHCQRCQRVRTEAVPWARPRARHSRDFEDVVAWLAQRTDKTTITRLLRTSWETVAGIVERVVAEQIDTRRLAGLLRIGVDEVSYRKGHRYLTVVADHDQSGRVVWAAEGKNAATLEAFYDQLGEAGCAQLEAVSMDLGAAFKKATDTKAPEARQCVDPFHLIALANEAINKARRWAWNIERDKARQAAALAGPRRRGRPPAGSPPPARDRARWVKHSRWALLKDPDALKPSQLEVLHELRRNNSVLYRCWQLKEGLRDLYRLPDPADAEHHLDWWLAWACRSRIPAFVTLSKTVRGNRHRILAAIELGLSNSKLEGLNSKIRLINHRGYGHHSAAALIAMIYLCCGGLTVQLPTER
jgi:transposase